MSDDRDPIDGSGRLFWEARAHIFTDRVIGGYRTPYSACATRLALIRSKFDHFAGGLCALTGFHRRLLPHDDGDLHAVIETMSRTLSHRLRRENVEIFTHIEDVPLSATQRYRLLLLVAKLLAQALKRNFSAQKSGAIWLQIRKRERLIVLELFDSSDPGCPSAAKKAPLIVDAIARSLDGRATAFERNGYAVRISFPIQATVTVVARGLEGQQPPRHGGPHRSRGDSPCDWPCSPPQAWEAYRADPARPVGLI